MEGGIPLRELNRKLGMKFPLDGPKTLNGLILEHLREIPEPGTGLRLAGYPLEIVQTQDRVVKSVRLLSCGSRLTIMPFKTLSRTWSEASSGNLWFEFTGK